MTVGGWFDAEDLYGPLNTYSTIEKTVKIITLLLWGLGVMAIGQKSKQVIGNINFEIVFQVLSKKHRSNFFRHF
jgi:hypothetical protein